ncbi:MAG TPA: hypothetical protein VFG56_02035 [Candidatus Saccharimonadales bacterium]|nr:hypothetical protein [Candidatus Saccharimonadales bacterium]
MAPKQDESTKPTDDGYEPQPVDTLGDSTTPESSDQSIESNEESASQSDDSPDNQNEAPVTDSDPVDDTDQSPASDTTVTSTSPADETVASDDNQAQSNDSQTTYVNPNNSAAFGGAAAGTGLAKNGVSRRKKLLIGLLAGLVLILAILVGLWFWYNSTSKVMGDAIDQLLSKPITSSQGTFSLADPTGTNGDIKVSGDFSSRQASDKSSEFTMKLRFNGDGTSVEVPLDVIAASNGDLYVKVSQVKQLLADLLKSQGASSADVKQMQTYFSGLISKVDDQWIKVSKDELNGLTSQASSTDQADVSCVQSTLQKFYADSGQQRQIKQAFSDHPFVKVDKKLGNKDISGHSSLGYSLKADENEGKAFAKAIEDSQLVEGLKKCGLSTDDSTSDSADDSSQQQPTVHMEVWVDRWNHQFTQFVLSVKDKTTDVSFSLQPSFDEPTGKIDIPSDATTLDQLRTELQQSFSGMMMSQLSSQSTAVTLQ